MNKKIAVCTICVLLTLTLVTPNTLFAESESSRSGNNVEQRVEKLREKLQKSENRATKAAEQLEKRGQNIASRAARLEEKKASFSAKLEERKKKLVSSLFPKMVKRFIAASTRQENILSRINTRITKLETNGKNVTELKTKAAAVSELIDKQKAAINALQPDFDAALSGQNFGQAFNDIKTDVKTVTDSIKLTQKALVELITAVAKVQGVDKSARPSNSATPSASATASGANQ